VLGVVVSHERVRRVVGRCESRSRADRMRAPASRQGAKSRLRAQFLHRRDEVLRKSEARLETRPSRP
jgi:hypothetical protein